MKRRSILLLSFLLVLSLIPLAYADGGAGESDAIRVLLASRAIRSFSDEPVSQEDIDTILQCGLRAPSAVNGQPWHFTVVRNREIIDRIVGTNGLVIVISGSNRSDSDLAELGFSVAFDCGLATHAMYTAAQTLGLGSNIYLVPVKQVNETMREVLAIPDDYDVVMIMTVGHVATDAVSSASSRNGIDEMVTYID